MSQGHLWYASSLAKKQRCGGDGHEREGAGLRERDEGGREQKQTRDQIKISREESHVTTRRWENSGKSRVISHVSLSSMGVSPVFHNSLLGTAKLASYTCTRKILPTCCLLWPTSGASLRLAETCTLLFCWIWPKRSCVIVGRRALSLCSNFYHAISG